MGALLVADLLVVCCDKATLLAIVVLQLLFLVHVSHALIYGIHTYVQHLRVLDHALGLMLLEGAVLGLSCGHNQFHSIAIDSLLCFFVAHSVHRVRLQVALLGFAVYKLLVRQHLPRVLRLLVASHELVQLLLSAQVHLLTFFSHFWN